MAKKKTKKTKPGTCTQRRLAPARGVPEQS